MRALRQRFWLIALDAISACGGFGSRAYGWVLVRTSNATDWGYCPPVDGEEPF